MFYTQGANATAYSSLTVNGVPQFQPANPAGGLPKGTTFTSAFFNDVQGELINIVLSGGDTPAVGTPTQVLKNLKRIFGGNFTTLNANTTLTLDQLGLIKLTGSTAFTTILPAPDVGVTPPILVANESTQTQIFDTPSGVIASPGSSGASTMSIAPGQLISLQSDGANYVASAQFLQKAVYNFSQSGSIVAANNTTYTIGSIAVTFPPASHSGAFRVLARLICGGAASGSNTEGFQNILSDGTNNFAGASVLINAVAGNGWQTGDTIRTEATYLPGSTVAFTQMVATYGSETMSTIAGCSMQLYVEEA